MEETLQTRLEDEAMRLFDEIRHRTKPKTSSENFARKAFPELPNGRLVIQRMRNVQSNGKKRAMSLGEFVRMCMALDKNPVQMLAVVLERFEETKI